MSGWIFFACLAVNTLFVPIMLFFERNNADSNPFWTVVILFLPYIGFLLYLLFGTGVKLHGRRRLLRCLKEERRSGKTVSYKEEGALSGYFARQTGSAPTRGNHVAFYTDMRALFDRFFEDIDRAQKFVHIQFYIIRQDALGKELLEHLVGIQRQGVPVRLLYDAVGSSSLKDSFFNELREAGGEVVRFFGKSNLNYRNHRKIAVIDEVGYVGATNVGCEYLGEGAKIKPWRDLHLRLEGPAVRMLDLYFLQDFNFSAETDYRSCVTGEEQEGGVLAQIVADGPDRTEDVLKNGYVKAVYEAKSRVWLQTPYLIPDRELSTALKTAAASGVDVRIMLPKLPDKKAVYCSSLSHAAELIRAGCRVYLWKGFLHSKSLLVDSNVVGVGSFNVDQRSFLLNFEISAFLYDEGSAAKMEEVFLADQKQCVEYTLRKVRKRTAGRAKLESAARFFSPLM